MRYVPIFPEICPFSGDLFGPNELPREGRGPVEAGRRDNLFRSFGAPIAYDDVPMLLLYSTWNPVCVPFSSAKPCKWTNKLSGTTDGEMRRASELVAHSCSLNNIR